MGKILTFSPFFQDVPFSVVAQGVGPWAVTVGSQLSILPQDIIRSSEVAKPSYRQPVQQGGSCYSPRRVAKPRPPASFHLPTGRADQKPFNTKEVKEA